MHTLLDLWHCALHPVQGFRERAAMARPPREAFWGFLAWRVPIAAVEATLAWQVLLRIWAMALDPAGMLWTQILPLVPDFTTADLTLMLAPLPRPPSFHAYLPLVLLLGVLGPPSVWLHHVAWDHASLRLLRGTKARSLALTAQAESEALTVGALGAALGLLAYLPGLGCALNLVLMPLGIWFWVLRGYALAAYHQCPLWKGITATLLHVVLVLIFYGLVLLLAILIPVAFA